MKPWAFLVLALVLLGLLLVRSQERFQPEILDKRQVDRTVKTQFSSYAQETNHMPAAAGYSGRVEGIATPFQVNQYKAFVPL
jgi:hypothetical protein